MARDQSSTTDVAAEEAFELDLDTDTSLDEALEDAVASVGDSDDSSSAESADRVAELETEVATLRDRQIRTLADFDNYRKRAEREKQSLGRYAMADPFRSLLDVLDNLRRALEASGDVDDLKKGVEMTLRGFEDLLKRHGVETVASVDRPFDPTVHEAVSRQESDTVEEPTVVAEFQRGYLLHDRLLRPSMVTVAMPTAAAKRESDSAEVDETPGGAAG